MATALSLQLRVGVDAAAHGHSVAIGLSGGRLPEITGDAGNVWFLNLLSYRKGLTRLARLRRQSLLKLRGVGNAYADAIQGWQKAAFFAADAELVGQMIQQDTARILELGGQIKTLEGQIAGAAEGSAIAGLLASISGFGATCSSEFAGEIGTVARFRSEAGLSALSRPWRRWTRAPASARARSRQEKPPRQVNARAKPAPADGPGRP